VSDRVLLTGATGYVGGRLLPHLEERDGTVRCMARRPEHLADRVAPDTEVEAGDVLDPSTLGPALAGVDVAYYLIHSMGRDDFRERDRRGARNFAAAAAEAGVRRIIYLGGLGHGNDLSEHLASRQEVGRILRESGVPTTEFRASVIIGSGSLSFEIIRALVERLPVMTTPRWVRTPAQPIAVEDVVAYLLHALDREESGSPIYEIGGSEVATYGEIMREYARQRGLRRLMIPVPVLSPGLSSLWLALVTPVYARVGRKLIDGLRNDTTVQDPSARRTFPVEPRNTSEAIARALAREDREVARTRWCDALSATGESTSWGGLRYGTRRVDSRTVRVDVTPERAFAPIRRIGGETGWYHADLLWRARGVLDLLAGGAGMRRGRRDPEEVQVGDTLDFWRVEAVEPGRLLRLRAEMKLPGRAWLQFEVEPSGGGGRATIRQTAIFDPRGLAGLLYWYGLYPAHALIFRGMLRSIARRAEEE
jgi:uncharacterized protein YbjT (DUF2867 family)